MLDARYRRLWDSERLPGMADFDPANDLHLDELASLLLERFAQQVDAEAFALLVELTRARLERMAARLAARVGLDPGAQARRLVKAVLRRLWCEARHRPPPALGFLLMARGLMEQELRRSPPAEAPHSRILPRP